MCRRGLGVRVCVSSQGMRVIGLLLGLFASVRPLHALTVTSSSFDQVAFIVATQSN